MFSVHVFLLESRANSNLLHSYVISAWFFTLLLIIEVVKSGLETVYTTMSCIYNNWISLFVNGKYPREHFPSEYSQRFSESAILQREGGRRRERERSGSSDGERCPLMVASSLLWWSRGKTKKRKGWVPHYRQTLSFFSPLLLDIIISEITRNIFLYLKKKMDDIKEELERINDINLSISLLI